MWRSNVLRLRSCSSALRHGKGNGWELKWYSSGAATPVSNEEFIEALDKVLPREKWDTQQSVGFAISGGVDSMALATLYSNARRAHMSLPRAVGIIVDHKVRPQSTEEAAWVAQQLKSPRFDFDPRITTMSWSPSFDPHDHKRFESEARILRYQALGRLCKQLGITSLLLGHHADDQAETIFMRLAHMRFRTGLAGMHSVEWIPECYGMHGVHHSDVGQGSNIQKLALEASLPFPIEQGGIRVLRPLLGFEKSRLIATCKAHGVPWAEDKTNQIKTLTARNAIRHILRNNQLPEALSIKSLVRVSQRMQRRIENHKAFANKLFDDSLVRLDIQTGSLIVRIPPTHALLDRPIETESDKNEARNNAYYYLERLAALVSPREKPPMGQLSNAITTIFPPLDPDYGLSTTDEETSQTRKNFCAFGVWWQTWRKPSPFLPSRFPRKKKRRIMPNEYLLSRQPLAETECNSPHAFMTSSDLFLQNPHTKATGGTEDVFPPWRLFDGRFWIRARPNPLFAASSTTPGGGDLILRTLDDDDILCITSSAHTSLIPPSPLQTALSNVKPHALRRHLPAIFQRHHPSSSSSSSGDDDDAGIIDETLVALPTLDIGNAGANGHESNVCTWEIRYKKIDTGARGVADIVGKRSVRDGSADADEEGERFRRKIWKRKRMFGRERERERGRGMEEWVGR